MSNSMKFVFSDSTEISFEADETPECVLEQTEIESVYPVYPGGFVLARYTRVGLTRDASDHVESAEDHSFWIFTVQFRLEHETTMGKLESLYAESAPMLFYYELLINSASKKLVGMNRAGMRWHIKSASIEYGKIVRLQFSVVAAVGVNWIRNDLNIIKV